MSKILSVIIVLVLLGLGVMGVTYFAKQNKEGLDDSATESTPTSLESTASSGNDSNIQLDADLAEIELEDPEAELKTTVDSDINSL